MICESNRGFKPKKVSDDCTKLCTSENIQTGAKGVLNHKKRRDIRKTNRRYYNLLKTKDIHYIHIKIFFGFKKNIVKHSLFFDIILGHILCWVLVVLMLDGCHVSTLNY